MGSGDCGVTEDKAAHGKMIRCLYHLPLKSPIAFDMYYIIMIVMTTIVMTMIIIITIYMQCTYHLNSKPTEYTPGISKSKYERVSFINRWLRAPGYVPGMLEFSAIKLTKALS